MNRLIETRHVAAVDYRDVSAAAGQQQDEPNRWLFLPQTSGGSITLPSRAAGQPSNQLYWSLHNHTTSTLTLAEVSLTNGTVGRGLRLHIPGQVFSVIAYHIQGDSCYLFLLLSSKTLGVLQLSAPREQPHRPGHISSVLDAVQPQTLLQLQMPQQLASLGVPTAITAVDGHLCIAGSEGGVVCLPLSAVTAGHIPAPNAVLQLNPSNFVVQMRRRMGFAANTGVVAAVPICIPAAGHQSLLVVHEDTSCHQWFVGAIRQGSSQTLVTDASAKQLRPNRVLLCHAQAERRSSSSATWDVLLVFDLGLADSSGQSDVRVMPFKLQQAASGSSAARLEPLLQQPQQLQLEWPDASLADAVVSDQQLLLLCSTKTGGSFVIGYGLKDWAYQGRCQLLQQCVASDWGMKEEMWSCALDAVSNSSNESSSSAAAKQVLSQLLVPGQTCLSSLVAALAYHGAQMTEAEAASASLGQLQARISAAVELIRGRYPGYSAARCWHTLFASYCEHWQQQHALMGLYCAPEGWLGAVRAGGLLTVLRQPSAAEVLLTESSTTALNSILQAAGASGASGIPGGATALAKVRLCLSTVGDMLGQSAMRVMTQAIMSGVSVEGELLPRFVELLLQGPPMEHLNGSSSNNMLSGGVQQRLAEWRLQRQSQLLFVQEQLNDLPHALETLSGVADLTVKTAVAAADQLHKPPAEPQPHTSDLNPGTKLNTLLCSIALHTTRAACTALQQLLLLLSCIQHLGCVGTTPLTAADQAAISTDLIPPLSTALRSTAVALWLCKTPASTAVMGSTVGSGSLAAVNLSVLGPLLGLRSLTPSGTPAGTPRGDATRADVAGSQAGDMGPRPFSSGSPAGVAAVTAAEPAWQQPLAAHLLPLFWRQQGVQQQQQAGAQLGTVGAQLAAWLMLGAGAEAAAATAADGSTVTSNTAAAALARMAGRSAGSSNCAAAAVTSNDGLAGRGVLIGYQLFVCREYQAMQRLVTLIGGRDPSEAGLQFILGLSIACGLKTTRPQSATAVSASSMPDRHAALLESAVGHLFRAAAGLCRDEAAPLRLVLQLLRQRQGSSASRPTSAATTATPATTDTDMEDAEHNAADAEGAVVLSYQACKEARLRLEFCRAVLLLFEREGVTQGALAFARAALGAVDAAFSPHQQKEKVQLEAALWTSVFNCASELDLIHDAYSAAVSNPVPKHAAESVRRLVQALVDRGQLQQLLSLPWAGVLLLDRQGLKEPVPVVELVIDKLTRRALHSELALQPSSHQVLFDFLLAWGNYKAAAAAMLSYARRLRSSAANDKQTEQEDAVDEIASAYAASINTLQLLSPEDAWLDPAQPLLSALPAPAPRVNSSGSNATAAALGLGSGKFASLVHQLPVLTLRDVKQEAALFSASALLLKLLPGLGIMQYELSADYILEQLLGAQQFAAAVELIHAVWDESGCHNAQLVDKLELVAFALAAACVELQQNGSGVEGLNEDGDGMWAPDRALVQGVMSYTGPGHLDSDAAAAWFKLRQLLELYDRSSTTIGTNGSNNGSGSCSSLGGRLRIAAVDGALSTQPELQLPAWLTQPFQPAANAAGGMAGMGADPAALLRVYIKHGRLVEAAQFVKGHFEAWQNANALLRSQPGAVWLPLQDLELLHASLVAGAARAGANQRPKEAEVLGTWSEVLEAGLAEHLALVRSDGEKIGIGARGGAGSSGGRFGVSTGMVY